MTTRSMAALTATAVVCAVTGGARARQCGEGWTYLAPSMGLTASDQEIVYDSGRDLLVFFRGAVRETWEFDFATLTWSLRDTANGPSARTLFGMAYDATRAVTVLHAGQNQFSDTWEWNGATWTRIEQGFSSEAMANDPTLAFDPITGMVMRIGGSHYFPMGGWASRQLGFWAGTSWLGASATLFPTVMAPSLASDPVQGIYLVTGGKIPAGGGPAQAPGYGTAVSVGGGPWTNIEGWTGGGPHDFGLAFFDPVRAAIIRERNGGLQEWTGAGWNILETGLESQPHALTFDAGRGRLITIGALNGQVGVLVRSLEPMAPRVVSGTSEPIASALTSNLQLTANVGGSPGWTPQWFRNGEPLLDGGNVSGATTNSIFVQFLECDDYGVYEFRSAHACGESSKFWTVTSFFTSPSRTPSTPKVNPGTVVTFHANVTDINGANSHAHQWRRDGVALVNGGAISGVTTPTLVINGAHWEHRGSYDVVVSIACGGTRTSAPVALGINCQGDATSNGLVNFEDLNLVLSNFGATGAPGATPGDVTGDGVVNFQDLNLVIGFFGTVC